MEPSFLVFFGHWKRRNSRIVCSSARVDHFFNSTKLSFRRMLQKTAIFAWSDHVYPLVNLHNYGKSPFWIGKLTRTEPFSIAMLDYYRVYHVFPHISIQTEAAATSARFIKWGRLVDVAVRPKRPMASNGYPRPPWREAVKGNPLGNWTYALVN